MSCTQGATLSSNTVPMPGRSSNASLPSERSRTLRIWYSASISNISWPARTSSARTERAPGRTAPSLITLHLRPQRASDGWPSRCRPRSDLSGAFLWASAKRTRRPEATHSLSERRTPSSDCCARDRAVAPTLPTRIIGGAFGSVEVHNAGARVHFGEEVTRTPLLSRGWTSPQHRSLATSSPPECLRSP